MSISRVRPHYLSFYIPYLSYYIWINANDAMCWMCFGCNGIGNWIF
jgi:hypothetical protein